MKQITIEELLELPRKEFIDRHLKWIKEFDNGATEDWAKEPLICPLHIWVVHNRAKCKNEFVSLTAVCEICGNPICPDCYNHKVTQLSRVTGYMAPVDQWGAAKKQEFKDRQRHTI